MELTLGENMNLDLQNPILREEHLPKDKFSKATMPILIDILIFLKDGIETSLLTYLAFYKNSEVLFST